MIEIRDLKKIYRLGGSEVRALDGVSLKIEGGEFVAIMGASGSGKSTLLQVLGLLDGPDSGSYKLLGKEVSGLSEDEAAALRSKTIGFVFQQFNLLARTTALDNVRLPRLYSAEPEPEGLGKELLKQVGLAGRLDHSPAQLSGGQQQRVAIARALMNRPALIFADEPTGNLDSKSSQEILDLLDALNRKGISIVMVTHEADIAARAKRVIVMKDGKVLSDRKRAPSSARLKALRGAEAEPKGKPKARSRPAALLVYAAQAWRSLMANKLRSALSVLGILIGVAAVVATMAVGAGATKAVKSSLASLGSNLLVLYPGSSNRGGVNTGSGNAAKIRLEDAEYLARKVDEVRYAIPEVNGRVQAIGGGKNWNTMVTGTGVQFPDMRAAKPALGRFFDDSEFRSRARVAVIGVTVARNLFGEGNPVGQPMRLNRVSFTVIGVLPAKGSSGWRDEDDKVVVPTTTAMYRLLGRDFVESITVEIKSDLVMNQGVENVKAAMRERLRLSPEKEDNFQIFNMADMQKAVQSTTTTITSLLLVIAGISLMVGGIGIMNIMLVSVTERTREIGLRKALGARRGDILFQFLVESVVVAVFGGLAGVLLGGGISFLVNLAKSWPVELTPASVLTALLVSGFTGIAAGLWPARKASLLRPIEALRYE